MLIPARNREDVLRAAMATLPASRLDEKSGWLIAGDVGIAITQPRVGDTYAVTVVTNKRQPVTEAFGRALLDELRQKLPAQSAVTTTTLTTADLPSWATPTIMVFDRVPGTWTSWTFKARKRLRGPPERTWDIARSVARDHLQEASWDRDRGIIGSSVGCGQLWVLMSAEANHLQRRADPLWMLVYGTSRAPRNVSTTLRH
jgi:hypothetical protein